MGNAPFSFNAGLRAELHYFRVDSHLCRGGDGGSPGTGSVYRHLFQVVSVSLAQEVPSFGNPSSKYCPPHQPFQSIASQTDTRASPEAQPASTEIGATKRGEKGLDLRLNYILHNLNIVKRGVSLVGI